MNEIDVNPNIDIEEHPWPPFIPNGAKVLILGTFPPGSHRWSMDFYYPNRTNDFWKIMGYIFLGDKDALYDMHLKQYNLDAIKSLLIEYKIALNDTGRKIKRLKGNASDKYLDIIEPVPLFELLGMMPDCRAIATTGEKAANVIAALTGTAVPKMGEKTVMPPSEILSEGLTIWRLPSTSRAYPLALEKKAAYYETFFKESGVI